MSVSKSSDGYECAYCSDHYTHGIHGSFCSHECFHKHKGENIIRQIKSDHTVCTSCFGTLKNIDKPPRDFLERINVENGFHTKQAIIGFEYTTPRVEYEHGFSYCRCGNIDHYAEIDELRGVDLQDVLVNLWGLLREYYQQDQFGDNKPHKEVLFDTLKESDLDWRLALGKAVYGRKH